jgi:putative aldouronate transport system permease protein
MSQLQLGKIQRHRRTREDWIFDICNYSFMCFLLVVMLYPMLNTLAISLNDAGDSLRGGIHIWPREFSTASYEYVFSQSQIYQATVISVLRTVVTTVIAVFCTALVAYVISSHQKFVFTKIVTLTFVLTMYFNGGLIPTYLLMRELGLIGSFWVYVFPHVIHVFSLLVVRSFIDNLPKALFESARIDGAGDFTIFTRIVLPLSMPVLATVTLFVAVHQWNEWFDVYLYNPNFAHLSTLQYELMKLLQNTGAAQSSQSATSAFAQSASGATSITPVSVRATMTIIASVPIILVYPFLQKYFIKGLTLGGVKG